MWSLLFESGYKDESKVREALSICAAIYDPKAEQMVVRYALLALWHCQVGDI